MRSPEKQIGSTKKACENRIKLLQEENTSNHDKLIKEREAMSKVLAENRDLKTSNDDQFSQLMSLKTQLSSAGAPSILQSEHGTDRRQSRQTNMKPYALLIGTSNTEGINEERLSPDVITSKTIAYTLDETLKVVQESSTDLQPDVVVLHSLTNDVKDFSPSTCVEKMEKVIDEIEGKWENTKCVVSLTTPRMDDRTHSFNCEILNGLLKRKYHDNQNVYVSDNSNLWHGPTPVHQLLDPVGKFHLNDKGCAILASNLKYAIHTMLGIKTGYRGSSPRRYRGRGFQGNHRGRGKRGGRY